LFKIFPAYSINVALIFLFGLFTAGHENWNLKLLLANLFMVQDIFSQDLLNGVFWTLLIEIKFYAFIALQYLVLRDRGMLVIPLMFIMANTAIWLTRGHASVLLTFFPAFYVGIQIYRAECRNWDCISTLTACGTAALAALSLFMFDDYYGVWSMVYLVGEAALLALFLRRDVSSRLLNFFGRISYSDYLYHVSLGYLVFSLLRPTATWTSNLISVLIAIALTTVVAYISFRLIEVPMVAFGKVHEPLLRSSIKRVRARLGLLNQA
jgi:peptidoglycan/LPS O-acetylase OafA/YrhL